MTIGIADIITEARGVFDELRKHGYKVVSVDRMADIIDRIEKAANREREAGAEAAQICGEIGEMIGREAACKQSVTNCNRLEEVIAALSTPPRNCDVGTVEEQIERFQRFCGTRPCDGCTLKNKVNETLDCAIHWAQLPYEEGDNE